MNVDEYTHFYKNQYLWLRLDFLIVNTHPSLSLFLTCSYLRKTYWSITFHFSHIYHVFTKCVLPIENIKEEKNFFKKKRLLFVVLNKSKRKKEKEVVIFKKHCLTNSGCSLIIWSSYLQGIIHPSCSCKLCSHEKNAF